MVIRDPKIYIQFISLLAVLLAIVLFFPFVLGIEVPLLSGSETGISSFSTSTLSENYDELLDQYFSNSNTSSVISSSECGNAPSQGCLWVPWMNSSSQCSIGNLKESGPVTSSTKSFTHNIMVSDEFSQVCIEAAMGNNQTRFQQCYNTLRAINTTKGQLPAWKIYRNGSVIHQCHSEVNPNCDSASDATHRFIISLYTAANNSLFTNETQKAEYRGLATNITRDSYQYELTNECYDSKIGTGPVNEYGQICHWLQTGWNAQTGGLGGHSAVYTGYFADAVIAFMHACVQTGNQTYCSVASNISLNYLQASYPNGTNTSTFRAPPGKAFHWTNYTQSAPAPVCDQECDYNGTQYGGIGPSRPAWDAADAPRATGLGHTLYYANISGITLPGAKMLLDLWVNEYALDSNNTFLYRYYDNGTAIERKDNSSYKVQGFQSYLLSGADKVPNFNATLRNALGHYHASQGTWDFTDCFGTYDQNFPIRSLGMGIGRDLESWNATISQPPAPICSGTSDTILVCLLNPPNGSIQNDTVSLHVNVTNGNVSSGGEGFETVTEHTFESGSHGWSGGSQISGGDGYLNMSENVFSPDLDLSALDVYQVEFKTTIGSSIGNYKFYPLTEVGTFGSNDKFYFESASGGKFALKHDPEFIEVTDDIDPNSNITMLITVDKLTRQMHIDVSWNNGTSSNSSSKEDIPFSATQNSSVNEDGVGIEINGVFTGYPRLYNFRVLNESESIPGNDKMNLTFFNDDTGSAVCPALNNIASGGIATCTWPELDPGTYNWRVNVTSENNFVQSQKHTFEVI